MSNKKGFFGDTQNIIAVGVTLISVCALVVSIMQTRIMSEQRILMHEQAKASVWPRLTLITMKSHDPDDYRVIKYQLKISNDGVGPAIIKGMRVTYKGEVVKDWWDLFDKFELPDSVNTYIGNAAINGDIIKIGEESMVLDLSINLPLAQIYYDQSAHIMIEIFYESIYGDKWKYTLAETERTESVQDFDILTGEQFNN